MTEQQGADFSQWLNDAKKAAVPDAAPTPAADTRAPAPKTVIDQIIEPPEGCDPVMLIQAYEQQYVIPAKLLAKIAVEGCPGYTAEQIEKLRARPDVAALVQTAEEPAETVEPEPTPIKKKRSSKKRAKKKSSADPAPLGAGEPPTRAERLQLALAYAPSGGASLEQLAAFVTGDWS